MSVIKKKTKRHCVKINGSKKINNNLGKIFFGKYFLKILFIFTYQHISFTSYCF